MSNLEVYGFVVLGVIAGVLFPVISAIVRTYFPREQGVAIPLWLVKYLWLFGFGLFAGVIAFAIFLRAHPGPITNWYEPFLAGFSSQSAIDAILRPKPAH
jgi:MFS family permease